MSKTLFIGFSGKIGSGKNYIAEQIFTPLLINKLYNKNTLIVPYYFSFGDHLKVECLCRNSYESLSDDIGYYGFFCEKTKETRDMLQKYGTENGREKYHENIWIRAVDTWVKIQTQRLKKSGIDTLAIIIISDIRFKNEVKYIEDHGGIVIRIDANDRSSLRIDQESNGDVIIKHNIQNHESEISLDDYEFKYVINNSLNRELIEIDNDVNNIINDIYDVITGEEKNKQLYTDIAEEFDHYVDLYTLRKSDDKY